MDEGEAIMSINTNVDYSLLKGAEAYKANNPQAASAEKPAADIAPTGNVASAKPAQVVVAEITLSDEAFETLRSRIETNPEEKARLIAENKQRYLEGQAAREKEEAEYEVFLEESFAKYQEAGDKMPLARISGTYTHSDGTKVRASSWQEVGVNTFVTTMADHSRVFNDALDRVYWHLERLDYYEKEAIPSAKTPDAKAMMEKGKENTYMGLDYHADKAREALHSMKDLANKYDLHDDVESVFAEYTELKNGEPVDLQAMYTWFEIS